MAVFVFVFVLEGGVVFVFSKGIQHSTAKWLIFDSLYLQLLQSETKTKLYIRRLYVAGMTAGCIPLIIEASPLNSEALSKQLDAQSFTQCQEVVIQ